MGLCHGKSSTASPCWSDLPPEIIGLILSRLPFHDDRLSFKAVCRGWYLAARQQRPLLPPAMPCINLGHGKYLNTVTYKNGRKTRRRFSTPRGFRARATFGGWVLYEHKDSGRCFLRGPFSMAIPSIEIPCRYRRHENDVKGTCDPRFTGLNIPELFSLDKIIVCSSRLIVMKLNCRAFMNAPVNFACFRPCAGTTFLWSHAAGTSGNEHANHDSFYVDIVFHLGMIFAVSASGHLFAHRFVGEALDVIRSDHVIKEPPVMVDAATTNYHLRLVTSSDKQKLLMVSWGIPRQTNHNELDHQTTNIQVFEAELNKGQWSEVKDLDGQLLFVGKSGSKAIVPAGSSERYYGEKFRGGNRVVILGHEWERARWSAGAAPCRCLDCQKLPCGIPGYCVYDMVTGKTSLVSLKRGPGSMRSLKAEWFFPSV